jgi:hypothetical protein
VAAGIAALALGRVLPNGTGKIYASDGRSIGWFESRGKTAIYYDELGRPIMRSELVGSTMRVYDAGGRQIGYARPGGSNRVNLYSAKGELLGYEVFDNGRIVWHFAADGTLIAYTLLGEVDLAALGVRSAAIGFSLSAAAAATFLGDDDKGRAGEPTVQTDRTAQAFSPKVVAAADKLFRVGNRCRNEGHVESCRSVTLAYVDLSEAIRGELARLSPPQKKR